MEEPLSRMKSETAHVLFMDVVGYSLLPMEKQNSISQQLLDLVKQTSEFQQALAANELICLDTGDGMALIFMRDPVAPVQCALEVAKAVDSNLRLRMGINSGHVSRITDINGHSNIRGPAINMAQRIMDCGDAGHILLSARDAEDLQGYEFWASRLFDLGECQVKHDVVVHVYNLYTGAEGNMAVPEKIRKQKETGRIAPLPGSAVPLPTAGNAVTGPEPAAPAPTTTTLPKVVILYKRHSADDEYVRNLLETKLTESGYEVFIDLRLKMGVEWAKEIERQIQSSYAVVPLISAASVNSEMLEDEVKQAQQAAEKQGKPHLLPIRLKHHELLPSALGAVLNPLQYATWEGAEDDAKLAQELLHALANPPAPPPADQLPSSGEQIGGAVPLNSKFYIARPADNEFKTAVARRDSIILVKGGRQMGKTSLLARGLQQAREAGVKVVTTDLQTFNESHMASPDALFQAMAAVIAEQLDLDVNPKKTWDPDLGPNMNLEYFLKRKVLNAMTEPLMWGLDEVDRLFTCPFGSEVFGLFRSWHNRRSLEPNGPWSRLSLAIAYATEAHLFITDLNQSPFNVGTRLALEDFTIEQISELNHRYGGPLKNSDELTRFHKLLGGQPYLVQRGLDDMVQHKISLPTLVGQADRDEGLFGDHLRRLLVSLLRDEALTASVKMLLQSGTLASSEHFYRLRTAGLIAGDTLHDARFRCDLYACYMEAHLQ